MTPGLQSITWDAYWGAHWDDTRDFSYWITKPGFVFSATRELAWADFEEAPFCTEIYDDKNPAANPNIVADKEKFKFTTKCQVPARTGRHVIYGEWGRRESTYQRFHGCIDVAFGATTIRRSGEAFRTSAGVAPAKQVDALGRRAPADGGARRKAKRLVKTP
jgi:chitin-binding protein